MCMQVFGGRDKFLIHILVKSLVYSATQQS